MLNQRSKSGFVYRLTVLARIFFILLFAFSPVLRSVPVAQAASLEQEAEALPPAAPVGLTAAGGDGAVDLTWQPNSEADLAGYNLYRGLVSGAFEPVPLNADGLLSEPAYLDAGLENGLNYYYVVTAVGPGGESTPSEEASATPQASVEPAPEKEIERQPVDAEIEIGGDEIITPQGTVCMDASLEAVADTTMRSGTTRSPYNYGGSTSVRLNPYYQQGGTDDQLTGVLLRWDLSALGMPGGGSISSASLTFNVTDGANYDYQLYNLRRTWTEGSNNGASGSGASWNFYGAGTGSWGTTGAQNTISDRYETDLWDATPTQFNTTGSVTIPLNASGVGVVQGWLTTPANNFGLTIQNYSGTVTDIWVADSKESTNAGPTLNLTYCLNSSGPMIWTSGSLATFSTSVGTPSAAQTYRVMAADLTENLVISAPVGFELSSDGSNYETSLSLAPTGGVVNPTIISVRLSGLTEGSYSGNITHTSAGASPVNVAASGTAAVLFTLTVNAGSNGTVALSPSGGLYASGTVVTLTATPSSGYGLYAWSGDLSGRTNPTTITMDGNKTVTATFAAQICNQTANVTAAEDTYLSAAAPTYNYGSVTSMQADVTTSTNRKGILIKWDLSSSSIPANATISSANVQLTVLSSSTSNAVFNLYNMRRIWVEGTNSPGAEGSGASWNFYGAGTGSWVGASSTADDRYDANLWGAGSSAFSSAGTKTLALNTYGISAVQGWVNFPSSNNGVTMQNYTGSSADSVSVYSSEFGTAASRPILAVTYCAVPTAATITTSGTLSAFSTALGTPSAAQTYTVSGINLGTTPISITPPGGFELSTDGSSYSGSLSLTPDGSGMVPTTTIYVRLTGAAEGTFSGNITHTSGAATQRNVAASGTVIRYYTLTTSATNGSIALNPSGGSYASGTVVTVTATGNSGYMFTGWSGDLGGSTNPTTITMSGDRSVTASFAPGTCATAVLRASADNYLSAANVTYNNGGNTEIHVDNTTGTARRGALLRWDVSDIPDNAVVSAASVQLYVTNTSGLVFNLYNMRRDWTEGTSNSAVSSTSSNWNTHDGVNSWGTVGAANTSSDRYDANLWSANASSFSAMGDETLMLNTNGVGVVQGWISGSLPNYGVTVQNYATATSNAVYFSSREVTTVAQQPTLNVTYCAAEVTRIRITGTLNAFTGPLGSPSAAQTYNVSGVLLTEGIQITAPAGFEVSTDGSTFNSSLTVPQSGGSAAATVYVRMTGAALGDVSGSISHTSAGATDRTIAVSGTVIQYYTLTTSAGPGGTISPASGSYPSGTVVTVTATPNANFAFSGWSGDLGGSTNPTTITMSGDRSVTASFAPTLCTTVTRYAVEDNWLRGSQATTNFGGMTTLSMNANGSNSQVALIQWDLSGIPADATINSASITMNVTDASPTSFSLYNLLRNWVEGNGTSENTPSTTSSNWNTYNGTTNWGTGGAQNTTSDRGSTNLWDNSAISTIGQQTRALNTSGVAILQGWLTTPANNNGFTIQNTASSSDYLIISSSEATLATERPALNITYCTPITTPTIITSGTLVGFNSLPGVESAAQTYTVAGLQLNSDIEIAAPPPFEISTNNNVFSSNLLLYQQDGVVEATTIYVRLHSEAPGSFGGDLVHTSTGATAVNVPVTGTVSPAFTLSVETDGHGTVALSPAGGVYTSGTVVSLIPTGATGYAFSHWNGANGADIIRTAGVYTITMTENKSIHALFGEATNCNTAAFPASDDTYLSANDTDANNGANVEIHVDATTGTARRVSLHKWDLSGSTIPPGATVTAANIQVYVLDASPLQFYLYNMRRNWVEGTGTQSASGDGATWDTYDGSHGWGTVGVNNLETDRFDTNLWDATTTSFSSTGNENVNLNAAGRAVVQGWLSGSNNYGLTIQNQSGSTTNAVFFHSNETTTTAYRPTLNVTYCTVSSTAPSIATTSSLEAFTSNVSMVSAQQSYTVSASNLSAPLVISAAAPFEISDTGNDADFEHSITLPGGTVAATTIYIRFRPTTAGAATGVITHVSAPATQVNINLSGTGINGAPTFGARLPADNATGMSTPPNLSVVVNDPNGDVSDVSFYGRSVGGGTGEDFTFVLIPDPQNLDAAHFNAQTQWIGTHKDENNIVFVTTLGDMVNTSSSTSQYVLSDTAIDYLDTYGVRYSVAPGNHDIAYGATYYDTYFGLSRYDNYVLSQPGGWFGEDADQHNNYNTYSLFSAGGMDFILINLQYSPTTAALTWAEELLDTYSNRRAIVEQHDILNIGSTDASSVFVNQASYTALRDHANLFLMVCGHMHSGSDGAAYASETGTDGHTIHIVQADYQDMSQGYLRLLRFSPANDMIYQTTYSPYLGTFRTDTPEDHLDLAYDMVASMDYELIGTLTGVASGSTASISWAGLADNTAYEWYAVADDGIDESTSATWSFTTGSGTTNVAPVISGSDPRAVSMSEDGAPTAFSLSLSATDANTGDTLTWSLVAPGATHGTATVTGTGASPTLTYAPTADYNGADSFVAQVSDGNGGTDTVTVNVTVNAENDAPVLAEVINRTIAEGALLTFTATAMDVDLPGDTLIYSLTGVVPTGASIVPSSGLFTWTPTEVQGPDSFTFNMQVCDASDACVSDEITVTVSEVNVAPVLAAISDQTVAEGALLSYTATATDVDLPANTLTFSLTGVVPPGAAIDSVSGVFTWTPTEAQGPASYDITVSVCDTSAACDEEEITITVTSSGTITYNISLLAGWNLVSFNIHPISTDVEDLLAPIASSFDLVYAWDASGAHLSSGHWLKYDQEPLSLDSITDLDETMGFWIHMTAPATLTVTGTPPTTTAVTLSDNAGGWNLVAYPSAVNGDMPAILDDHGADSFSMVYAYRLADTTNPWKLYDVNGASWANDLTQLLPGGGYWVMVGADQTWMVAY